jgi:hypothetical protein
VTFHDNHRPLGDYFRALEAAGFLWDVVFDFGPSERRTASRRGAPRAAIPSTGSGAGRKVEEHVRDERSTISWLLEPMMRRSGFEIVHASTRRGDFSKHVLRAA